MPVLHPTDMGLALHTVKSPPKLCEGEEWGLGCWPGVWDELCSIPCFDKSLLCYLEQGTQGPQPWAVAGKLNPPAEGP